MYNALDTRDSQWVSLSEHKMKLIISNTSGKQKKQREFMGLVATIQRPTDGNEDIHFQKKKSAMRAAWHPLARFNSPPHRAIPTINYVESTRRYTMPAIPEKHTYKLC